MTTSTKPRDSILAAAENLIVGDKVAVGNPAQWETVQSITFLPYGKVEVHYVGIPRPTVYTSIRRVQRLTRDYEVAQ